MDLELLRKAIADSGLKMYAVSDALHITQPTLRAILQGRRDCTVGEMNILCNILNLTQDERAKIFYPLG